MRALVRDYSRPGDLVCDPCCGAGTTLRAAIEEGRRAIGGDIDAGRLAHARKWCARPVQERIVGVVDAEQEAMPWVRE
jgi:tRNA G10  N-methylase Trm11